MEVTFLARNRRNLRLVLYLLEEDRWYFFGYLLGYLNYSMHLERTRHVTQRGQTNYPQLPEAVDQTLLLSPRNDETKEIPAFKPLHAVIARKAPRESRFAFEISVWTLSVCRLTGEFSLYPLKCVNYPRIPRGFLKSNRVSHRTSQPPFPPSFCSLFPWSH